MTGRGADNLGEYLDALSGIMLAQPARANGVRYFYTGNVHDRAGGSTWCHGCGALLIGRDWFDLTHWRLGEDGCCMDCGTCSPACLSSGPAAGDASVSRCACSSSGDFDRRCPTVVVASPPTI